MTPSPFTGRRERALRPGRARSCRPNRCLPNKLSEWGKGKEEKEEARRPNMRLADERSGTWCRDSGKASVALAAQGRPPPSREGTALGRLPLPPASRPNQQATLDRLGPAHPRRSCRPRRPQRSRGRATPAPSWQQRQQGSDRWDLSFTASTVRPAVCRPAPQRHLTGACDAPAPRDPGPQWLAA